MGNNLDIKTLKVKDIHPYKRNPRKNDGAVDAVAESIRQCGYCAPIVVDENHEVLAGHTRLKAIKKLGWTECEVVVKDGLTEEQKRKYRLLDNKTSEIAEWDLELLDIELEGLDFDGFEFGFEEHGGTQDGWEAEDHPRLRDRFVVPPVSVLDARQGYWQERKRAWQEQIGDKGQARDVAVIQNAGFQKIRKAGFENASLLDPVLAEAMLCWFAPQTGNVFDVFAGDTAFGYVSSSKGYTFTGVELREEQCEFNRASCEGLNATYICDDGRNVLNHLSEGSQDFLFSCPPYFDLEVYSDLENDASNQKTYEGFYSILDTAFANAIKCLKNNRFAVIVCGDVRNKKTGEYYRFPDDIKGTFQRNGMILYNELVLVDQFGTAGIRAAGYMENRKVVKVHQNVLVFYKGDTKMIKQEFPRVEVEDEGTDLE